MDQNDFSRFHKAWAIHPDWRGNVLLSPDDDLAIHEGIRSRGHYVIVGNELTVVWEKFAPDMFTRVNDIWVHHKILADTVQIKNLAVIRAYDRPYMATRVRLMVPEAGGEVELRLNTSDGLTFWQVFINAEYESDNLPATAATIVDLGANIGLATLFFAARYPAAQIMSVEPSAENFEVLLRNTVRLGPRVHRHQAAVWLHDGQISLRTEDDEQRPLGAWGVQVTDQPRPGEGLVPCYRLSTLFDLAGFQSVDILKIDIEGAELELFGQGAQDCLARVRLVIIETHDRFRPGSEKAVHDALAPLFDELPRKGENLFFARKA